MAAACLTAVGDPAGFPALQESLAVDGLLMGSHPPLSLRAYALGTLARYVPTKGVPAPPKTDEEVAATARAWSAWLGQHADALHFDAANGTWTLP